MIPQYFKNPLKTLRNALQCHGTPRRAVEHRFTPVLHRFTPVHTGSHRFTPVRTGSHRFTPQKNVRKLPGVASYRPLAFFNLIFVFSDLKNPRVTNLEYFYPLLEILLTSYILVNFPMHLRNAFLHADMEGGSWTFEKYFRFFIRSISNRMRPKRSKSVYGFPLF